METELFPCLVEMKFLRRESGRDKKLSTMKQRVIQKRSQLLLHQVKKETGIDTQIWAATIDRTSL